MPETGQEIIDKIAKEAGGITIPEPLQKGILKAANRLLGGAIDIPAAWLEGFAEDFRATTEAKRVLRLKAAEALANNFKSDSPLANRAFARQASKILGEQINMEDIVGIAIDGITSEEIIAVPQKDIDDDWFNTFEAESLQKSSEEMKVVFGKLLAGEIKKPGSFSISAIKTIGAMDLASATLFRNFCCMTTSLFADARVIAVNGNPSTNAMKEFGLTYHRLNILREFGLINSDYNSQMPYGQAADYKVPIEYLGKKYKITRLSEQKNAPENKAEMKGISLTRVGIELRQIVDLKEVPKFTTALKEHFKKMGLSLEEIKV